MKRKIEKYAQLDGNSGNYSDWRWMTIAQHHGLPTRLLDWTYFPFVAAHFATADPERYNKDGVIWQVDFVRTNQMLPPQLLDKLEEVRANAFTISMLETAVPNVRKFDDLSTKNNILFFEPPSMDDRIVNQFALFSVMSGLKTTIDDWLVKHPHLFRRLIIPKELKWEIRDKLDQANITERTLFPGLDGLASWLRRHYLPRC